MMDHSDTFNLQDVMTTTSNDDIPDLEDIFRLKIWTMVWMNICTPCALCIQTNAELYETR